MSDHLAYLILQE